MKIGVLDYKKDNRPEIGLWAPGDYTNVCSRCDELFIGDKRAIHCADCAYDELTISDDLKEV